MTPVNAPMVGKIVSVEKKVGDSVNENDVVVVLEAMKMKIKVVAPVGGIVKEVKVSPGDVVEADAPLVILE